MFSSFWPLLEGWSESQLTITPTAERQGVRPVFTHPNQASPPCVPPYLWLGRKGISPIFRRRNLFWSLRLAFQLPCAEIVQGVSIETAVLLLGGKPAVCPLLGAECWRELPGIESTRGSPRLGGGAAECSSEWAASRLCGSWRPPGDAAEGRACSLALWFGRAAGPRSCVQPYGWPLEGAAAPRLLRQAPPAPGAWGACRYVFVFSLRASSASPPVI